VNNIDLYREWNNILKAPGNEIVKIRKMYSVNSSKNRVQYSLTSESIGIYIEYEVLQNCPYFTHGINVFTSTDIHLFSSHDSNLFENDKIIQKGFYSTIVWIPINLLQSGNYLVSLAFMRYNPFHVLFNEDNLLRIQVVDTIKNTARPENCNEDIPGLIRPKLLWDARKILNTIT